jgi:hypothetical protein
MQDVEVLNLTELTKLRDLCHHRHEVVAAEVKPVSGSSGTAIGRGGLMRRKSPSLTGMSSVTTPHSRHAPEQ